MTAFPEIILAEPAGFCFGVRRAVEEALQAAGQETNLCSLGPLIHNPQVVKELAERGITVVEDLDQVKEAVVILRTHGAPPETYASARDRGLKVIDLTCPFVKKAQARARSLKEAGYRVVIVGDPDHPEVQAVRAWAGGDAAVVTGPEEVDSLPAGGRVGVVAQTTQSSERVQEVVERLKQRAGEVRVENTICTATRQRQEAARRLAGMVDAVLVVGGRNSSNTRKLAAVCREAGKETYLVERASEVRPEWFLGKDRVGVTAGASTPDWIIKEVVTEMEEMKKQQVNEEGQEGGELPLEKAAEAEAAPAPAEEDTADTHPEVEMKTLRPGDLTRGRVMAIGQDSVLVDVGYKSEGVVPIWELSHRYVDSPQQVVKVGDEIDVFVLAVEGTEGVLRLSKKRADEELAWERLVESYRTGKVIDAPVVEEVKGGLIVDVGVRGFMPASHVERGYVSDLGQYVGRPVRVRVIELDRDKNRVILSQKVVLEEEYQRLREETLATVEEGQVRKGTVKSVTDFGAFVDIGGVDGLLHVSEMSWGRVNHPSEVVQEGDEINVMILRVDREKEKISLGLKQTLADPWENVEEKYRPGSTVDGRVVRTVGFGAFVELEPGVEGLVHISQLANRRVATPEEVVSVGDQIRVKVLRVNQRERRISLSLREVERDYEKAAMRQYMADQERDTVTIGEVLGDILQETKHKMNRSGEAGDEASTDEGKRGDS